ncbi:MAG: peptide chain release factor N(5)-glutamine methyltransferase [Eubacteriales bacterium]
MNWRELFAEGRRRLEASGNEDSFYDARALLQYVSGMTMTDYPLRAGEEAGEKEVRAFREAVSRRCAHEPLQYITGYAPFYGRDFLVRPGVLIPRFDTETLIEAVKPHLRRDTQLLDLCTGSGCILLTLMLEGPADVRGTGADISEDALNVARENAERFHVMAELVRSNLYSNIHGVYDIITSNPPYIRTHVIDTLAPEVRDHEPRLALDGEEDGLAFYRRITEGAPAVLKAGGLLAFEIGYDQAEAVTQIMEKGGFGRVTVTRDLAGNPRVAAGILQE